MKAFTLEEYGVPEPNTGCILWAWLDGSACRIMQSTP